MERRHSEPALPGADPGLEREGELRKVDEALLASVRGVVGQGLAHQVGGEAGRLQPALHLPDGLQGHEGVKVAVEAHHVSARLRHSEHKEHASIVFYEKALIDPLCLCLFSSGDVLPFVLYFCSRRTHKF
jgi:hypothetical protein